MIQVTLEILVWEKTHSQTFLYIHGNWLKWSILPWYQLAMMWSHDICSHFHDIKFQWSTSMISNSNDLLPRYQIPMIYFHDIKFQWSTSMISNSNDRLLPRYGNSGIYFHDIIWKKWKYRIASRDNMEERKKLHWPCVRISGSRRCRPICWRFEICEVLSRHRPSNPCGAREPNGRSGLYSGDLPTLPGKMERAINKMLHTHTLLCHMQYWHNVTCILHKYALKSIRTLILIRCSMHWWNIPASVPFPF